MKSIANASALVNDALVAYDKFVDNGLVKVLNLGYWNKDYLKLLGMKRVTEEAKESVVAAFKYMGITAEFKESILRVTLDVSKMPINWRSQIRPQ